MAGFIVGAFLGLWLLPRGPRHGPALNMTLEDIIDFILGAALIGAGLASFFGDRLWIGLSYRIIPPDGVRHSELSRAASIATGTVGGLVLLLPMLRHFGLL